MKLLSNAAQKISKAADGWKTQLLFGLIWAIIISLCVALNFAGRGWELNSNILLAITFYFSGSLIGGALALLVSTAFATDRSALARFAFFFVALSVLTLVCTLILFIFQHRQYFTQWHADFPSITWTFQLVFTTLGSIVLFLITGLRPLLPFGIAALFLASVCFSRGWLTPSR